VVEERQQIALQLRVGVFVILGLLATLGMVYLLGARAALFEARYKLYAEFAEVGGLTEGATVRLAGVQIGRVTAINLPPEPGGKVRVVLTIARQYANRIRANSVVRIETQGLLGDKIVEVSIGSPESPAAKPGDLLEAREPLDLGQTMGQAGQVVTSVGLLAESLRHTVDSLNESKVIDDVAATLKSARVLGERVGRVVDRVEKGPGLAHVLLYEEPIALKRLDAMIASAQAILDRSERGEGALGVLTGPQSTEAARRLVSAMDRLGRMAEQPSSDEGLLPGLLFDPQYRSVLDDLRVVAHNFRDVSDRIAGGKGTLGALVKDEPGEAGLAQAKRDLQAALANMRQITAKINEGEGTVGALIVDPTIYERLVAILDGTQRSFLLRGLLHNLGKSGEASSGEDGAASGGSKK